MSSSHQQIVYPGSEQYSARELASPGSQPLDLGGEPVVRVHDAVYIMFEVPDLELQQRFLEDFGLKLQEKSTEVIYMRGYGPQPYCYVARRGASARFVGVGFSVRTLAELELLARETGVGIEAVEGPGGGQRVRLHDPDGIVVDVVHGREHLEPLTTRRALFPVNTPDEKRRVNRGQRPPLEPAAVERFGHCVLSVTDFKVSWQWYRRHLGVLPTDVLCTEDGNPVLAFNRLDRGDLPADHHTVVLAQGMAPGCMHSAYEILDLDAIGQGQQYLKMKGWNHFWGIGRHILGSQIFDYWLDPNGQELEHYADGDVFDSKHPTGYHLVDRGGLWAWGNDVPDAMRPRLKLRELFALLKGVLSKRLDASVLGQMKQSLERPPRPWLK